MNLRPTNAERRTCLHEEDEEALDAFFAKALAAFAVHGMEFTQCLRRSSPVEYLLLMRQANPALLVAAIERKLGKEAERLKDEARNSCRGGEIANVVENGIVAWMANKHRRPH